MKAPQRPGRFRPSLSPGTVRWLRDLWSSLWLQPVLLALAGAALGAGLPELDRWAVRSGRWPANAVSADAAADLLGAAATTVGALLAVGFSIATVTVQLAASQYTPRLLRRFMGDHVTKHALGAFTASLTYLLVVMRSVRHAGSPGGEFVPSASVAAGVLLSVACVSLLPFFLHHVTRSIQVETIVTNVARDAARVLGRMDLAGEPVVEAPAAGAAVIASRHSGYLQGFEPGELLAALPEGCEGARVDAAVGDFVLPGAPLVRLWPAAPLDGPARRGIEEAFAFSRERNLSQDVLFGVRQLVDMALRGLSPGVNDVTTAVMALNELGALTVALVRAGAPAEATWRVAHGGPPRLLVPTLSVERFVRAAFDEIVLAAREQPRVLEHVVAILEHAAGVAEEVAERAACAVLARAAEQVRETAEEVAARRLRLAAATAGAWGEAARPP